MIIKETTKEKFPFNDLDNIYVVADFDRTITDYDSATCWSVLSDAYFASPDYVKEASLLYSKYRPLEISSEIALDIKNKAMEEWFLKHMDLLVKYKMGEEFFRKVFHNLDHMKLREGAKEFLTFLSENDIPIIIMSGGITNIIEKFLVLNNCYYDNIHIISNRMVFDEDFIIDNLPSIIHSYNKNETFIPEWINKDLRKRKQVILLGDQAGDLHMIDKSIHDKVLSVGFLPYDLPYQLDYYCEKFDIVCDKEDDYHKVKKLLF